MSRDELLACGRAMLRLLEEFGAGKVSLDREGESWVYRRGYGLEIRVEGAEPIRVPEAAFEDFWMVVDAA